MVDASDHNRIPEAREELDNVLKMPELRDRPIVVFGKRNKLIYLVLRYIVCFCPSLLIFQKK